MKKYNKVISVILFIMLAFMITGCSQKTLEEKLEPEDRLYINQTCIQIKAAAVDAYSDVSYEVTANTITFIFTFPEDMSSRWALISENVNEANRSTMEDFADSVKENFDIKDTVEIACVYINSDGSTLDTFSYYSY